MVSKEKNNSALNAERKLTKESIGPRTGQLAVHLNQLNAQNQEQISPNPLWVRSKNQGDHWQHAQVQYDGGNPNVKNLMIKGFADYLSAGNLI